MKKWLGTLKIVAFCLALSALVDGPVLARVANEDLWPAPSPFAARIIRAQNDERGALGLTNLQWTRTLEADADAYALELAATDKWQHSRAEQRVGQGENLWMGTHGAFSPEDMVNGWLNERAAFRAGTFPNVSTTGNWEDVGHYTQIIWPGARSVGCSLRSSPRFDYLVCRYAGAGNVMGEYVASGRVVASR